MATIAIYCILYFATAGFNGNNVLFYLDLANSDKFIFSMKQLQAIVITYFQSL